MRRPVQKERIMVTSLDDVPDFASEDEEREWWATHDLVPELGEDGTGRHRALLQRWAARQARESSAERKAVVASPVAS
jgi:hypothetical protein